MSKLKQKLEKALKTEPLFLDSETGELNYIKIKDSADKIDEKLISLLADNKELKDKFFSKIKDVHVFNINDFKFFLDESKIDNSYTKYANKIGLSDGSELLKNKNKVVLDFPFKDCVLEGGQSTEEGTDTYFRYEPEKTKTVNGKKITEPAGYKKKQAKRKEIFFNQVLAHDEIDRLYDRKALVSWKRFTKDSGKNGETVKEIKRDESGLIRENLIIKGNNLLVLHSLKSEFAGKIKLIYIDPPYNTGNDGFDYNDRFNHSAWLTFMKNRLEIAKELLSEDGVIFVQCDDNEQAYLKVLMDEVFNYNFINNITVKMSETSGVKMFHVAKRLPKIKEYLLVYGKSSKSLLNPIRVKKSGEKYKLEKYLKYYQNIITNPEDEVEKWNIVSLKEYLVKNKLSTDKKSITDFQIKNAKNIVYRTNNKSFEKLKIDKKIDKIISSTGLEYVWWEGKQMLFLSDYIDEYVCDLWTDISTINLNKEGGVDLANGKKPEKLLERIIEMTTTEDDLVLDFHLGSGTTGAVAHKMNRQYIGVEQIDSQIEKSLKRLSGVVFGNDKGGIVGKAKKGGSFLYCELAKWNEQAKEEINNAKDLPELTKLLDTLYEKYFLNYNVCTKDFKEKIIKEDNFKKLSLNEQKKMFLTMLDLNQMYVQESEMADKKYGISKEDQKLTKEFYKNK
jgi:adenine-specific DNA-methyltransferase